jgi:uncharacterized membrane protein (UPF0182 family)
MADDLEDDLNARFLEHMKRHGIEHRGSAKPPPPRRRGSMFARLWLAAIAVIIVLTVLTGLIQKGLWMSQLHYLGIFWTLLGVQWGMFAAAFVIAFLFLWLNFRFAAQAIYRYQQGRRIDRVSVIDVPPGAKRPEFDFSPKVLSLIAGVAAAFIALFFALGISSQWDTFLRFRYGGGFGLADPLFHHDVGFYVFQLPFYELLQSAVSYLALIALIAVVICYAVFDLVGLAPGGRFTVRGNIAQQFTVLFFILIAAWGWGFYLDRYELLYSTIGVVFGAGYTAAHVTHAALWAMVAASAVGCALLVWNFFRPRFRALGVGLIAYAVLYLVGMVAVPRLFQKFVVQPSELSMETPYLKHYIGFTRKAYGLDAIQETSYPALPDLTANMIARNQDTIQNILLWDPRPLLQTFQQTQAIRLYYQFYKVDVDRYHLADGYHQVMLSSRELSPELPARAQTWVNQHLQFTHGYGVVMNFASQTVGGGFPKYLIENVPPQSEYGLNISQPSIYYGEGMPGYRIVNTKIEEFDYPKGNNNVYTHYEGVGGIPFDSLWKRLLFAWTQRDINILFTSYLGPQSRIQIWRDVRQRVSKIAPFLVLDHDPYAVVSNGRLYWIQDAYTATDQFPYSERFSAGSESQLNYIRNSVKVVVDMYNGSVDFYAMDPSDPILKAYERAFPGVFKSLDQLPPDLKQHLRYPEDMFAIQMHEYKTFHMTDPQVFYNREDLWDSPHEEFEGSELPMQPYYILMKLPGSTRLEYLLMMPFTPHGRDNMIAWVAARCDFPGYGKMIFYELPKEKLIYGPNQIEAMLHQNTNISEQLTLWNQQGSHVVRGKLVVIPIENSFLYVVPLYLRAQGTNFPQLKRVIAVTGDKVAMEPTLDEAVAALFGSPPPAITGQATGQAVPASAPAAQAAQPSPNLEKARSEFDAAQKAMQEGNWEEFGKAMQKLNQLLHGTKK